MENTFNVFVDNYMRAYLPLWKMIYKKYSGKHMQPGQKNSMEADEFADFMTASGWINDGLASREAPLIFNLSMMVRVDELEKSVHLEANFTEFLEMVCRCAEQSSFAPPMPLGEDGMP